jgi:hypothetical protein
MEQKLEPGAEFVAVLIASVSSVKGNSGDSTVPVGGKQILRGTRMLMQR